MSLGLLGVAWGSGSLFGVTPVTVTIGAFAVIAIGWAIGSEAGDRRILNRVRGKRCWHCGYSLIGNVSGICPECAALDISKLV
jgi:hypothetical protein